MSEPLLLGAGRLAGLLAHYPQLGAFQGVVADGLSAHAAAALFATATGTYLAKRYPPGERDQEELRQEQVLLAELVAAGYPTPRAHPNRAGATLTRHEDAWWVVLDRARGEDRYAAADVFAPYDRPAEAEAAGAALARFHLALAGHCPPPRPLRGLSARCRWLVAPAGVDGLQELLAAAPELRTFLTSADQEALVVRMEALRRELAPHAGQLPVGIVHGDFIKRNLFWHQEQVVDVIDLELWNVGPWLFDLALAVLPAAFEPARLRGGEAPRYAHLHAMLAGYQAVRPLTQAELASWGAMVEGARVEFYLAAMAQALARGEPVLAGRFWELLSGMQAWFQAHPEWRRG